MPQSISSPKYLDRIGTTVDAHVAEEFESVEFNNYAQFWHNICTSIYDRPPLRALKSECAKRIFDRRFEEVQAAARAGSVADLIDQGIRLYTGCSTQENKEEGAQCWFGVTKDRIPDLPAAMQARACACLAYAQWEVRADSDDPESWNIDAVYRACALANMAVERGLVSPIALVVAQATENAGLRWWEDMRFELPTNSSHGVTPDKFAELTYLWEVADRRNREFQDAQARRVEKHARRPNAYVCAAEGCGIEATSKKGLMRCAGPCRIEDKPSYCSKECQRRDWKHHKKVCKSRLGATNDRAEPAATPSSANTQLAVRETDDEALLRKDGKEYSVDVPLSSDSGKAMRLSSTTLSPTMMRSLRDMSGHAA